MVKKDSAKDKIYRDAASQVDKELTLLKRVIFDMAREENKKKVRRKPNNAKGTR